METYEDILERMRKAYEQESGQSSEDVSDAGLRLKVLAGELYRLMAQVEWLSRQAFPHTAQGEWLDRHGEQRGVTRRQAAHAKGALTFNRYLPLSFDVVIPKGTVCACPGEEPIEYETTKEAVLSAGALTIDVPAQAVVGGTAGNAAAGYINTLVTPPAGVNYVTNKKPFTGGKEQESDEEYRPRVLGAYSDLSNGTNAAFYRDVALAQEGVTAAGVKPRENGPNTVSVYVWGEDGPPSEEVLSALTQEFSRRRELGVEVTVKAASAQPVDLAVRFWLRDGTNEQAAKDAAVKAL